MTVQVDLSANPATPANLAIVTVQPQQTVPAVGSTVTVQDPAKSAAASITFDTIRDAQIAFHTAVQRAQAARLFSVQDEASLRLQFEALAALIMVEGSVRVTGLTSLSPFMPQRDWDEYRTWAIRMRHMIVEDPTF